MRGRAGGGQGGHTHPHPSPLTVVLNNKVNVITEQSYCATHTRFILKIKMCVWDTHVFYVDVRMGHTLFIFVSVSVSLLSQSQSQPPSLVSGGELRWGEPAASDRWEGRAGGEGQGGGDKNRTQAVRPVLPKGGGRRWPWRRRRRTPRVRVRGGRAGDRGGTHTHTPRR